MYKWSRLCQVARATFSMSQCPTEKGNGPGSCRAERSAAPEEEEGHKCGSRPWRHPHILMGHAARFLKLRQAGLQFELLASVALASLGLLLLVTLSLPSSSDRRLPALLLSEGDLGSRIYGLCAARALTDGAGLKLKVLWKSDKWMPATRFSELFDVSSGEWDVTDDMYGQVEAGSSWPSWHNVASQTSFSAQGTCAGQVAPGQETRSDQFPDWLRQLSVPNQLRASSETAPCRLWGPAGRLDPCKVAAAVTHCYQNLNPTAGVKSLLVGMDWVQLNNSVGVLLQAGIPTDIPGPEPTCQVGNAAGARKLVGEVGLGAGDEGDMAARGRRRNLLESNDWLSWHGRNGSQHWLWSLHWTKQAELMLARMIQQKMGAPWTTFFLGGGPVQGVKEITEKFHPRGQPDTLGFATKGLQDLCEGSQPEVNGVPTFAPHHILALGPHRMPLVVCMRQQLATLLALSLTSSLLYSYPSGAVDFIAAQGKMDAKKSFLMHVPIKDSDPIPPLFQQKWPYSTYVDEETGLLYCSIPKVACTTLRLWMRRVGKLEDFTPEQLLNIHEIGKSGLRILATNYTQDEAIKIITNPAAFKFVFVRNPWSRMLSSYLDKVVKGGDQNDPWGWSNVFFGSLQKELPEVEWGNVEKHMSFPVFVDLVDQMRKEKREEMEAHIALQTDICAMSEVRYDFVGHMENLEDDYKRLMDAIDIHANNSLPDFGQGHATHSDAKLLRHYNKEVVGRVREAYGPDIDIPLNGILHVPPLALQAMEQ